MPLQVRITDPDGSNAVVMNASDRKVFRSINSSDEGGSFKLPKNDSKSDVIVPENGGYTKLWEIWDTKTNKRINYGPIAQITEEETDWLVAGLGRSALLADIIDSRKTFYGKIDTLVDDLRYENVSIEPQTTTVVHDGVVSAAQTTVFGVVAIDERYQGLSKHTSDNAIDGNTIFRFNEIELPNTYYTVDSFWSGMSKQDTLIVDLGEEFPIARIDVYLPWWNSKLRWSSLSYDFTVDVATASNGTVTTLNGRDFGTFNEIFATGADSHLMGRPHSFYLGATYSGMAPDSKAITGYGNIFNVVESVPGPINLRYIRLHINDVHMWTGDFFENDVEVDAYNYFCNPNYTLGMDPGFGGLAVNKVMTAVINDRDLKPENDCHASVVEIEAYKEILKKDAIKPLALTRIDNTNLQITYHHVPASSEITTTPQGFRKFEPGPFFKKFTFNYSGASSEYTKFFSSDCDNCYPDGFDFGIIDHNNTLIYSSDSESGAATTKSHMFTKFIMMKGSTDATVTAVDCWKGQYDPLSFGSSYAYTDIENDYVTIHFRGQSFVWYATVPQGKTGATVKIEIRNKNNTGTWTSYTTLENSFLLPTDIVATAVYEISYEGGYLLADTVYEIKITNLDGGYCSIDSIGGYWSASMSKYNEDSKRINVARPELMEFIYDGRFSDGRAYKWNKENFVSVKFEGDRVVLVGAKGRNYGKVIIGLVSATGRVLIPGGNPIGSLTVDLNTGKKGEEIPQYIVFDSNDYFTSGLPWGHYTIYYELITDNIETYTAYPGNSNFINRCMDCKPNVGTPLSINKYIYFDGAYCHEKTGISVAFDSKTHLDQVKSIAEAIQVEWAVTEKGLRLEPRTGRDTNEILREGQNTVVKFNVVNDVTNVASMLISTGASIDGIPLSSVVADRKTRRELGRTIMRQQDFRDMGLYTQLIGLARTELRKRSRPEKRVTVTHIAESLNLVEGDSFILYTKKMGPIRFRINRLEIDESTGREYHLDCTRWPPAFEDDVKTHPHKTI